VDLEQFRQHCLSKKKVAEETPFGPDTLVYKVCNKIFALTSLIDFKSINLKCDPEKAIDLRERYADVKPGWHMNKKHWNTVVVNVEVLDPLILQMIDESYELIVASLPKSQKELLK
jgi:predicted DNA-binding protein (MmcQ/YjbR family)